MKSPYKALNIELKDEQVQQCTSFSFLFLTYLQISMSVTKMQKYVVTTVCKNAGGSYTCECVEGYRQKEDEEVGCNLGKLILQMNSYYQPRQCA